MVRDGEERGAIGCRTSVGVGVCVCVGVGGVGLLGDGEQSLLSASIRKPRGDMGAGKTEGTKGGGGGEVRTGSVPPNKSPLEYTYLLPHGLHHLLPSPLHLLTMQMCSPAAAGTCCPQQGQLSHMIIGLTTNYRNFTKTDVMSWDGKEIRINT